MSNTKGAQSNFPPPPQIWSIWSCITTNLGWMVGRSNLYLNSKYGEIEALEDSKSTPEKVFYRYMAKK